MFEISDFFGYERYSLRCGKTELSVISLGAAISSLRYDGQELLLGFEDAEGYEKGWSYLNMIVGRYANRIRGGRVNISGREYQLECNEGRNQLHGGTEGLHKKRWTLSAHSDESFTLSCTSPDGECGYPGELKVSVSYTVTDASMTVRFQAVSDRDTVFAPTTHAYFRLNPSCFDTRLRLNASRYMPTDGENLPLGICPVDERFDFRSLRPIGENYDHCFIPDGECSALLSGEKTAVFFRSDFPAMQLYTGEFLPPAFEKNAGFALEPEFCPDSPNRSDCPSPLLKAGERFDRFAEYRFCPVEEILL